MNKRFLVTMILCAALPLALAFALIYGEIRAAEVKRVSGALMEESSRISETINTALDGAVKAQDTLADQVARSGDSVLRQAAGTGEYESLCFMAGDRSLKACAGPVSGGQQAAALKRYAARLDLEHGGPRRFFDFGGGPAPVLISRVPGKGGRAAGYLLGVLKRDVVLAPLARYKSYYLYLRGVHLEYAAAVHTPFGFEFVEKSGNFSMPVKILEKRGGGSYTRDGRVVFWSYTFHAPWVRTCLQVPVPSLYSGLREVRAIYFSGAALLILFLVMLMVHIMRRSLRPVNALLNKLEELSKGDHRRIDASLYPGDRNIEHANLLVDKLVEYEERARKEARMAALGKLAAQVAHDVRSPLAALTTALNDILGSLPREKRELAGGALARISTIAGELIENYRKPGSAARAASSQELGGLLTSLVAEKRAQFAAAGAAIELSAWKRTRAIVEPVEFGRMVSNLLNNAVEALEGKPDGKVQVELSSAGGRVRLSIKDNGKGIPPEFLPKLGARDATHGKAEGTGLGLYHARAAAERWGGSLKIESRPGLTCVTVDLPACAAPAGKPVFLLDNDELVHMNWKIAAKAAGADLRPYSSPGEFLKALEKEARDTPVYVDSELGADTKGEEIAARLRAMGFTDLTMSTGRSSGEFSDMPWLKISDKEPPWA